MATLIHEALRARREELGLSRSRLSRLTAQAGDEGLSEGNIERLEMTPGVLPSAETLVALARALEVEPGYFYEWPIAKAAADAKPSVTERARKAAQRLDGTPSTSPQRRHARGGKDQGA